MPHPTEITCRRARADERLLTRYLEILAAALARTDRNPAVASLVASLRRGLGGRPVLVQMTQAPRRSVVAVVRLQDHGLEIVDVPVASTRRWVVSREHVSNVVSRPKDFFADPLRFELPFDLPAPRSEATAPRDPSQRHEARP